MEEMFVGNKVEAILWANKLDFRVDQEPKLK